MIPKYSINFSWKKPGKSPRASGLLDPGFGRAGPRKNGSGGRVLQARPVARNITILRVCALNYCCAQSFTEETVDQWCREHQKIKILNLFT